MVKLVAILAVSSLIVSCIAVCPRILERTGRVSPSDIGMVLKVHNDIRALISEGKVPNQPRATNVGPLKWDRSLSRKAQKVADTCKFKHVIVKDRRWPVGQNIYRTSSTNFQKGLNVSEAIYGWFNEHQNYTFKKKFSLEGLHKTGHYTQLVWADTKFVGCGYVNSELRHGTFNYIQLFVCNYGPSGNMMDEEMYKTAS